MIEKTRTIKEILQEEEIKLSDIFLLLMKKRKVFFVTILVVVVLGMVKSCTTPVQYESVAVMLSEVEEKGGTMGQLGGLAGLAGINLSSISGSGITQTFSPELYPMLLENKPFLLDLIKQEFYFQTKGKKMSLMDYYLEEKPGDAISKSIEFLVGIPYLVLSIFEPSIEIVESGAGVVVNSADTTEAENKEYIYITSEENYAIAELNKLIKIENKGRMITLGVKMPEPLIAAEFNVLVFNRILDFVSAYQIGKQQTNLEFIEASTIEAELKFKRAQINLASFRDSNQGIISQRAKTREEQLELEYSLAFDLYSTLNQEFENSKIELKKKTPIFTTFEQAVVPNAPSNSSPIKVLILSIFVGSFLGAFIIFILLGRDFLKS